MSTVARLFLIALTVVMAAALVTGVREITLAPEIEAAAPVASREIVSPRPPLSSSAQAESSQDERQKTLAWLLLLLKEHRGAR
jgi:hypothetical protein